MKKVYIVKTKTVCYEGLEYISGVFASEESARRHIHEENRRCAIAEARYHELRNLFNQDLLTEDEHKEMDLLELYTTRCDEHIDCYEVQM